MTICHKAAFCKTLKFKPVHPIEKGQTEVEKCRAHTVTVTVGHRTNSGVPMCQVKCFICLDTLLLEVNCLSHVCDKETCVLNECDDVPATFRADFWL